MHPNECQISINLGLKLICLEFLYFEGTLSFADCHSISLFLLPSDPFYHPWNLCHRLIGFLVVRERPSFPSLTITLFLKIKHYCISNVRNVKRLLLSFGWFWNYIIQKDEMHEDCIVSVNLTSELEIIEAKWKNKVWVVVVIANILLCWNCSCDGSASWMLIGPLPSTKYFRLYA